MQNEFYYSQLFGSTGGISLPMQQFSANDASEDYPVYDKRWHIPYDEVVKCGSCGAIMDNNDLIMAACPSCGKVISALAEIDWGSDMLQADNMNWLIDDVKAILASRQQARNPIEDALEDWKENYT